MKLEEQIRFWGHRNIRSLHSKTVEITKDKELSLRGDCIIGVNASKACADVAETMKQRLASSSAFATAELSVGSMTFAIRGRGDPRISLKNHHDIVLRKSDFVCPRTLLVNCDKSSFDLPREFVLLLQEPSTQGLFRIIVE